MKAPTRIQQEKTEKILDAALDVFSAHGFRGATLDQIADAAGLSKPNLLYYFPSKEAIHGTLIDRLLENWLAPLHALDNEGDPIDEICAYIRRKLEMARNFPRESRLFANEILHGAPRIGDRIEGMLKELVDEKAGLIRLWAREGKIEPVDPYHLIFSIWSTTQHYADFEVQVRGILGETDPVDDAAEYLTGLFTRGLAPGRS